MIKTYSHKNWDWIMVSSNSGITIKDILANPDFNWNWSYVSHNPNLTIQDILNNPDKPWDYGLISKNKLSL